MPALKKAKTKQAKTHLEQVQIKDEQLNGNVVPKWCDKQCLNPCLLGCDDDGFFSKSHKMLAHNSSPRACTTTKPNLYPESELRQNYCFCERTLLNKVARLGQRRRSRMNAFFQAERSVHWRLGLKVSLHVSECATRNNKMNLTRWWTLNKQVESKWFLCQEKDDQWSINDSLCFQYEGYNGNRRGRMRRRR